MKKLAIIDTFGLLHRAWHAIPNLTTKDGRMVNAAYGFTAILLKLLKEIKPEYVVAAFDLPHETFRKKEYKEYKAQREAPDQDFIDQIDIVEDILEAFEIPRLGVPGYEADDIIGSLAHHYSTKEKDFDVLIVSGDLDTLQLVNEHTRVFTMKRGINDTLIYDTAAVKERYGLTPEQIIDMKAIAGDASDNIPGVKGIGEKGAINLLKEFGSLENIYNHIDSDSIKPRARELLKEYKKEAEQSKFLATIVTTMKIDLDIEKAHIDNYDRDTVYQIFQDLEFRSLLSKLPGNGGKKKISNGPKQTYDVINDEAGMRKLASELASKKEIAVDTETTGIDPLTADILGASISWKARQGVFIHLRTQQQRTAFKKHIAPILENRAIQKIGHNLKFDYAVLRQLDITLSPIFFDTLIAGYLLTPQRSLKLEELVFSHFGIRMQSLRELAEQFVGSIPANRKELPVKDIPKDALAQYGAEDTDMTFRLYEFFKKEITPYRKLFETIEMPLVPILGDMERDGISLDSSYLKKMEKKLTGDVAELEKKIYELAGETFNVSSTKQLKEILFEKLNIDTKGIKRKKTGLSTAASELEKLKDRHEIIPLLLDYREITKLINTYVSTLPDMINPNDKRIHTSFNQTVTATGRLSSSDPNLQNIPIRTELGRTIRRAFIADAGKILISADYSQIELRLAAIISKDKKMLKSFTAGEDIHARTAAEIHGVDISDVTRDQRRSAKEVNFGVLYGLGSTGLAQRTGMNRSEAKDFIDRYFSLYSGIKKYIEDTKSFAHENGYAETLFGRQRPLPEIHSNSPMLIAQAERMAVNMPIQGTAADLMKLAMITMSSIIEKKFPDVRMLLQVHDELVFEVPKKRASEFAKAVKKGMESVATYEIPLVVDVKAGNNWEEMENI